METQTEQRFELLLLWFSDLPNLSQLVFFLVTRFLGRPLLLAESQLKPGSVWLKAAEPPEWLLEVKERTGV